MHPIVVFTFASCVFGYQNTYLASLWAKGEQFGAAINKLTGNRLNVFLPKDFVTSVFKRYSTGLGLSLQDNFKV
ncbi:hypothetical protein, partial [Pedobacter petrophilus]